MAGHSKWSNIKHKKAKEDKKRAKIFSKLSRKIRVAVKEGGSGDPEQNPALRTFLDKAKDANMPKDNIQRAIDAGLGKGENGPLKEVLYEGFGPGGTAFLIASVTDNKNRTTSEIRHILNTAGGSLGSPGSVKYMFERDDEEGYKCTIPLAVKDEDQIEKLSDLADELREQEDVEEVYCAAEGV
jgi:YebC/PmpR family DNA-binding regulatory protein